MPIEVNELKSKSGHPVLRAEFISEVTVADARGYHAQLVPGARYEGYGHPICGNVTGVSSEVKKVFASQKADPNNPSPIAIILSSALARMAAGLTMRLTDNSNSEAFKSETEALEWLDGRMTDYLKRR
jgi:hypothetical protein